MSTTFSEFLRAKEAERKAAIESGRETIEEWRTAVDRLLVTVRGWLAESDPNGVLTIDAGKFDVSEERLGTYSMPYMEIRGLGRTIFITPKSRYTVATAQLGGQPKVTRAAGRVNLSDDIKPFPLYRFKGESDDIWMIDDLTTGMKLFDREQFEKALMSYLR